MGYFVIRLTVVNGTQTKFFLVKMSYNLPKYCLEVVDHAKQQFPNILISALRRPILEPFLFTVYWLDYYIGKADQKCGYENFERNF